MSIWDLFPWHKAVRGTHLMSKMVFAGFIVAWFFADSPIRRSWSVKETNEGVVKLPCSLATIEDGSQQGFRLHWTGVRRTNFDICSFVVGHT